MAVRRELLPILLAAAFLLIGPAQALAAPDWLEPESLDTAVNSTVPADVAADSDGNAVAVWIAEGEVRAAYRPRGGDWSAPESLDPGTATQSQPRVTVQPNGQAVAVWLGATPVNGAFPLRWARRPPGGDWSAPATIDGITCCPDIPGLEAGGDGSVTLMAADESVAFTYRKPSGSETWGARETLPWSAQSSRLAVGSDGSAAALVVDNCGVLTSIPCLAAAYRPPNGPWGARELIAPSAQAGAFTGYEVAASGSGYTAVWGESAGGGTSPPGIVRFADRGAGTGGAWSAPNTVAALPTDTPFCNFANCFDLAVGADGSQLAAWHQTGPNAANPRIVAALRDPAGDWGSAETVDATGTAGAIPFAGLTTSGVPVVAWGSTVRGEGVPHAAWRAGPDDWLPRDLNLGRARGGPPAGNGVYLGDLAVDGDGNAVTAWEDPAGASAAGFDGAGPRLSILAASPSGTAGQPLAFSATASDNWSEPVALSWLFGDGTGATGGSVGHAYGAGTFTASARATDAVGNVTEQPLGPIVISPAPTPTPDPCGTADTDKDGIKNGCDESNGAARPRPFKTVNATVVSGEVFVKLPGGASAAQRKAPKGFVRLEGAETIPVGSTLDTAHGRVKVRSAANTGRKLQTGQFFRGRFQIRQVRIKRRSKSLITDMRLTGSSFRRACRSTRASVSQRRKRSKRRVRRLFGDAKGSFRTSGRNAAATVRGTRWGVQDRCDGTLVAVQRGRVEVRDKVKRKTIVLRRGKTYLARAR